MDKGSHIKGEGVTMNETETVEAHVPITISIDVKQLLESELGWTRYNAGSYEDPEEGCEPGGQGRIIDVVAAKLAAALRDEVAKDVRSAVHEAVLAKVDGLIDEVMAQNIKLTSAYGEPKASPDMSLREAMIKAMTDRLEQRVDDSGKPLAKNRGWSPDTGYSYVSWHAAQAAKAVLDKEMMAEVNEVVKQIRAKAQDLVSQRIANALGSS